MPIYYVIWEIDRTYPLSNFYQIYKILKVVSCDMSEIDALWKRYIEPLQNQGRQVNSFIFLREPENPFRSMVDEQSQNK